jgi:hypothetical protein
LRNTKLAKENLDPDQLGRGACNGLILGFSAGTRYRGLLPGTPRYKITTKKNKKTSSAASIIRITGSVGI